MEFLSYICMEPDWPCVYKWLFRLDDSTTEREAFDVVFFWGKVLSVHSFLGDRHFFGCKDLGLLGRGS